MFQKNTQPAEPPNVASGSIANSWPTSLAKALEVYFRNLNCSIESGHRLVLRSSPLRVNVARDAAPALPVEIGTALLGRTPESASGASGGPRVAAGGALRRLGLTRRCRLLVDGSAFVVWPEAFGKELGIIAEAVAERLAQPLRGVAAGRLLALVARLAHVRRVYSTGPSPVKPGRSSRNFPRSTEKSPRPAVGRI